MSRRVRHLLKSDNCQHLPIFPHLKLSVYNHVQALIYRVISPIQDHSLYLCQIPKHSMLYHQLMHEYAQRLRALVRQSAVLLVGVFYSSSFPLCFISIFKKRNYIFRTILLRSVFLLCSNACGESWVNS